MPCYQPLCIPLMKKARTPNPCIDCNRYLKFGKIIEEAQHLGYDYIVTGHYARISI